MDSVMHIPNLKMLKALNNKTEGEIAYCELEQKYMVYKNDEWTEMEFSKINQDIKMSAYDINKQIYAQSPGIDKIDRPKYSMKINELVESSTCWMLYGKEIGYFTIFQKGNSTEKFSRVLFDCIDSIGDELKDIQFLEDGAVEIWIKVKDSDDITVLYLFDYKEGIVNYG